MLLILFGVLIFRSALIAKHYIGKILVTFYLGFVVVLIVEDVSGRLEDGE